MTRDRIEDFDDLKRAAQDSRYQRERPKRVNSDEHVGPRPVHGVTGEGMNGIQVDLERLLDAERELAKLHEPLMAHMRAAGNLMGPLPDGSSPIVGHMRRAFRDRADVDGGVQAILREYINELFAVRKAIQDTLLSYQALDGYAADLLRRQVAELRAED